MKKFLIIDTSHMLHRARHVVRGDVWTQSGMALQIMLNGIRKSWRNFDADHVVFCLDGKSWRKSIYAPYKNNRTTANNLKSPNEVEEDQYFYSVVDDFVKYISERTNCTVLQNPIAEADDLIARWIQTHPNDEHIIVSGDTDFIQLLADNTVIYDGINDRTLTRKGIFDEKGNSLEFSVKSNGKLKVLKPLKGFQPDDDWPEWATFVKYIRGDSGDNIFSAYPNVRFPKIRMVYDDRGNQGYEWNNFMLTKWTDEIGKDHVVRDVYNRNVELVNLTKQPDEVKEFLDETIADVSKLEKQQSNIGFHFLKFAGKYELKRIVEQKESYLEFLNSPYKES